MDANDHYKLDGNGGNSDGKFKLVVKKYTHKKPKSKLFMPLTVCIHSVNCFKLILLNNTDPYLSIFLILFQFILIVSMYHSAFTRIYRIISPRQYHGLNAI